MITDFPQNQNERKKILLPQLFHMVQSHIPGIISHNSEVFARTKLNICLGPMTYCHIAWTLSSIHV